MTNSKENRIIVMTLTHNYKSEHKQEQLDFKYWKRLALNNPKYIMDLICNGKLFQLNGALKQNDIQVSVKTDETLRYMAVQTW